MKLNNITTIYAKTRNVLAKVSTKVIETVSLNREFHLKKLRKTAKRRKSVNNYFTCVFIDISFHFPTFSITAKIKVFVKDMALRPQFQLTRDQNLETRNQVTTQQVMGAALQLAAKRSCERYHKNADRL